MSAKPRSTVIIECARCGFEREVSRQEIMAGSWKGSCPVCNPPEREYEPPTNAQPARRTEVG